MTCSPAALLALAVFALGTAGLGAWDLVAPATPPRLFGLELRNEQALRERARLRNGSLMQLWSNELEARSNLRAHVLPFYSASLVRFLREADEDVLVGRAGWMFLTFRTRPPARSDRELAGRGARHFAALDRRLAQHDMRLVVAPLPRKAVACRAYLPADEDPRAGIERALVRELRSLGVETVDVVELLDAQDTTRVWYRQDSHWTPFAQDLAAQAMCSAAGVAVPGDDRFGALATDVDLDDRSFVRTLGIARSAAASDWLMPADAHDVSIPVNWAGAAIRRRTVPPMRRCAIVGTSFTEGDRLVPYLRHYSGDNVWNAAGRGLRVRTVLTQFFVDHGPGDRPDVLLVEYPTYELFIHGFTEAGTTRVDAEELDVLDNLPPRAVHDLGTPVSVEDWSDREGRIQLAGRGRYVSSGDGTLLLRLRGRPPGPARVRVAHDGTHTSVPWPAGQDELLFPLVSWRANDASIVCTLQGAESASSEATVVTEYDLERGESMTLGARELSGAGWTQDLALREARALGPHEALHLDVLRSASAEGLVRLELVFEGGGARDVTSVALRGGATGVINLGGRTGERRVAFLRLSGSGDPGPGVVRRATLVGLAR